MTPKQKAEELVDKYISFNKNKIAFIYTKESSKQCALIAVDEILKSNPYKISVEGKFLTEHVKYDIIFWQEVKQEIEAL